MAIFKKTAILIFLLSFNAIFAQAPQKMSYQAIIRNVSGGLVTSRPVGIKISILKGAITGNAVYVETQNTTTDVNGLVSVEIGGGSIVSGSFATINWGNDSYFIKTETDPDGGSNYTITGTSQLLSVPYALYAENTKSPGKSTVYLRGDITDTEAAAQIAREVGPITEYIYITDTTALTTVNLDAAISLIKLTITNNNVLTTVTGNGIERFYDVVTINTNPSLTTLSFNALTNAYRIMINSNSALQALNFLALKKVSNTIFGGLEISNMNALTTINLPQLINSSILSVSSCPNVTTLNVPNFTNGALEIYDGNLTSLSLPIFSNGKFSLSGNQNLTSLSLPSFSGGSFVVTNSQNLSSISLPNYTIGGVGITNNASLTSVNLPSLQYTPGSGITITDNNVLPSINTPALLNSVISYSGNALTTVNLSSLNEALITITNSSIQNLNFPSLTKGFFSIKNNAQLTGISFPNLISFIPSSLTNEFSNNKLSSASINSILHQLVQFSPALTNKTIRLNNQNPLAPPTGQGIIDKATLVSAGNTVPTD